jgi:hypothetical protein
MSAAVMLLPIAASGQSATIVVSACSLAPAAAVTPATAVQAMSWLSP